MLSVARDIFIWILWICRNGTAKIGQRATLPECGNGSRQGSMPIPAKTINSKVGCCFHGGFLSGHGGEDGRKLKSLAIADDSHRHQESAIDSGGSDFPGILISLIRPSSDIGRNTVVMARNGHGNRISAVLRLATQVVFSQALTFSIGSQGFSRRRVTYPRPP